MDDLKQRVADKAMQPVKGQKPFDTVRDLLEKQAAEIKRALPEHVKPERLMRMYLTSIRLTPKLLECSSESLLAGVMQSAQLGLEPGALAHCYLLPFGNNVQFLIGYKGYIALARRSGELLDIVARKVYKEDKFHFEYGLENETLVHIPAPKHEGKPTAYYGIARFRNGGRTFIVMYVEEIEKHRARSKAKDSGPWVTDYDAMAMKTVIRVMVPYLPLSAEILHGIAQDESVKKDVEDVGSEKPDFGDGAVNVPYEVLGDDDPAVTPVEPVIETGKLV